MKTKLVAVVESNELIREGLKRIFSRSSFRITFEYDDLEEALAGRPLAGECVAVLVEAEKYAAMEEAELVRLRQHFAGAKIVLMCDRNRCRDAVQVGRDADGLILTTYRSVAMVRALELIVLGAPMWPAAAFLCESQPMALPCEPQPSAPPCQSPSAPALPRGLEKLSAREIDVMRLLCDGSPNKVIARRLDVAEATVKVHVKAILRKTGTKNRTEAALLARSLPEPPRVLN